MGQKANLISLRKNLKKSLLIQTSNSRLFIRSLKFLNFFEKFCGLKNILISSRSISFVNNQIFFFFNVFYRTNKIMFYKKKRAVNLKDKKKLQSVVSFFTKYFKQNKINLVLLSLNVLNTELTFFKQSLKKLYVFNKRFSHTLFDRRLNLFVDFIKICSLYIYNKVSTNLFLFVLCQIFKNLSKTKHSRFLLFVRELFSYLVSFKLNNQTSNILGVKLSINGKIKGKTRASSTCIQNGSIPIQSLTEKIDYCKSHIFTRYGVFGFQIWVYLK